MYLIFRYKYSEYIFGWHGRGEYKGGDGSVRWVEIKMGA